MDRLRVPEPNNRFSETIETNDHRSVIITALAEKPFDEESLHHCVCTYVGAERGRGRSPSDVIVALTELIERTDITPTSLRHVLIRRLIPWCVEAYFGHLGCEAIDGNGNTRAARGARTRGVERGGGPSIRLFS